MFGVSRKYDYHQWARTLELTVRDYVSLLWVGISRSVACSASHGHNKALDTREIVMEEILPKMKTLVMQGVARSLAACDCSSVKPKRLIRFAKIPPAINPSDSSFECSIGFSEFCNKIDIKILNIFASEEELQHLCREIFYSIE